MKSLVVLGIMMLAATTALADDADVLLVRAKAGPHLYSGAGLVKSALSVGLDFDYQKPSGFFLGVSSKYAFQGSDSTSSYTDLMRLHFLGLVGGIAFSKSNARLSFGLGLGALSSTSEVVTNSPYSTTESSATRLAIAPTFNLDIDISDRLFGTLGLQYVISVGSTPSINTFAPALGFGYKF